MSYRYVGFPEIFEKLNYLFFHLLIMLFLWFQYFNTLEFTSTAALFTILATVIHVVFFVTVYVEHVTDESEDSRAAFWLGALLYPVVAVLTPAMYKIAMDNFVMRFVWKWCTVIP